MLQEIRDTSTAQRGGSSGVAAGEVPSSRGRGRHCPALGIHTQGVQGAGQSQGRQRTSER